MNAVTIKIYERAELTELSIRPPVNHPSLGTGKLRGDDVQLDREIVVWNPGYYTFNMTDEQLQELEKEIRGKQSVIKIVGVNEINS